MANEKRLIKVVDATAVYNGIVLYMAENAYLNDTALDVLKMVANWLNEAPTVDAVEVVRCKDCESYDASGCYEGFGWCFLHDKGKMDNDYCSCGAKMDGDGNDN